METSVSYADIITNTIKSIPSQLRTFGQNAISTTKRIWREHPTTRPLLVYCAILSVFALIECMIAFSISHALIVIFCAFYTVHRALHYLILVLAFVMEKQSVTNNALFTPYSYGLRRLEVILRFSNGIFAMFIAFAFFTEGIQRLVEGHHIHLYVQEPKILTNTGITCIYYRWQAY
jgi:Co/Zn/Cd efflux system component